MGNFLIELMEEMVQNGFSSTDCPKVLNHICPFQLRTIDLNLNKLTPYASVGIQYLK